MQQDWNWENDYDAPNANLRAGRGWVALFLFLSLIACVLGALIIPGGLGALAGYRDLQAQNHETAIVHFNRGLSYLADNYPELARAEFEVALKYDSTFAPAKQKLSELMPSVNGTPVNPEERVAATLFEEARGLVAQKEWDGAITRLEQLRTLRSGYRTNDVADLLYQAYVGGGKAAVSAGQIELARGRFESALSLRNDPDVRRQRDLAALYLDGQQAVGYNWQTAIQKFAALYQQDPNYDDVKRRLFEAYVNYAEIAAKQNSPCLAEREYNNALALMTDVNVAQKRAQVVALCRQAISATPTPMAAIVGENFTWKISTGEGVCAGTGDIAGKVYDALGRLVTGVNVGYYADGIPLTTTKTNANGQYQFQLGKDAGVFHVVIIGGDGKTPITLAADVNYPGGNSTGCHLVIDWQRGQ